MPGVYTSQYLNPTQATISKNLFIQHRNNTDLQTRTNGT